METETELTEQSAMSVVSSIGTIKALKVTDSRTYQIMANGVLLLRKAKKFFEDRAKPRIAEAHKHHANLLADLKKDVDPIDEVLRYGNGELSAWDTEQTRLANIEQQRREAEQKKKEDEERKQLIDLAKKLGDKELAAEIKAAPSEAPPVVVSKDVPKVAGLSFREDWLFEVTDPLKVPREYLMVDESKLGKIVRALKNSCNIPGVRVYSKKIPVGRG